MLVLCLDAGSSSLKFALYDQNGTDGRELRTGSHDARDGWRSAVEALWRSLAKEPAPDAIGHRIVFGPAESPGTVRVDDSVLTATAALRNRDPLHLDPELAIVRAAAARFPNVPQFFCFDTAFFADLPDVARRLPLPRTLPPHIRRYGFHGLSYEWALHALGNPMGRIVLAHLGSGASLCAVRDGKPIDTTLGFGVLGGLMMATRPGDLDPSVLLELLHEGYTLPRLSGILYQHSGLLGVSGFSSDMRELLVAQSTDARAAQAVALFVHQLRKNLGAMIAVLGGIDALAFTGGIGERAPEIRALACDAFAFLGLEIDADANRRDAETISTASSAVRVSVVAANENAVIARHVWTALR